MKIEFPHEPEPQQAERFTTEDFDDMTPRNSAWLVKGTLPSVGVVNLAGPSTAGKTFFALKMAGNIAKGLPVLGHKSKRSGVCYVAAEGAAGVRNRMIGLRSKVGKMGGAIKLIPEAPDLTSADDVDCLRQKLGSVKAEMAAKGLTLGLVVIDTLAATTPGADENTAKDMGPVLNALQSTAKDLSLLVIVVCHTGKNLSAGIRGWSGQFANADGVIMLGEAHSDGTRTGVVDKVKDGQSGQKFAFRLESVVIDVDADGEDVTTCVVVDADTPTSSGRGPKLTQHAKLVLQALGYVIDNGGCIPTPLGPGIPHWAKAATNESVRKRAFDNGLQEEGVKANTLRGRYYRARQQLQEQGYIRIEGEEVLIWLGKDVAR